METALIAKAAAEVANNDANLVRGHAKRLPYPGASAGQYLSSAPNRGRASLPLGQGRSWLNVAAWLNARAFRARAFGYSVPRASVSLPTKSVSANS